MEHIDKYIDRSPKRRSGMNHKYPASISETQEWARLNNRSIQDARMRFAQFAILYSIASSVALREALVLKGGNALDFIWHPNRSTTDLDFSIDHSNSDGAPDEIRIE